MNWQVTTRPSKSLKPRKMTEEEIQEILFDLNGGVAQLSHRRKDPATAFLAVAAELLGKEKWQLLKDAVGADKITIEEVVQAYGAEVMQGKTKVTIELLPDLELQRRLSVLSPEQLNIITQFPILQLEGLEAEQAQKLAAASFEAWYRIVELGLTAEQVSDMLAAGSGGLDGSYRVAAPSSSATCPFCNRPLVCSNCDLR